MTNRLAIALGLVIIALVTADHFWLHWNLPVFVGRRLLAAIEYLAFWR
ncbi:hypothetical protein SAMN05216257_103237 [Meinhardsimonia xiamenensis]|jgi:hypothetical protein|uniref:Glyceraldehyde-3-phosphate dehydrogenase n=1 Tax=Meinhardsimonia xiamenensis TaxID=990712 RepID=A0A1G9CVG1_9RHOB|nr:hypothetical protein [Meinhardsimonia xiamenensis]PRX38237.1 hypothetical protein LV81_00517 [Meinhardsimonia xiamenensis]SDK55414.1 hypothetical protein SAMN05216257_103237 [Meinhardsimonia xiamenensis]